MRVLGEVFVILDFGLVWFGIKEMELRFGSFIGGMEGCERMWRLYSVCGMGRILIYHYLVCNRSTTVRKHIDFLGEIDTSQITVTVTAKDSTGNNRNMGDDVLCIKIENQ